MGLFLYLFEHDRWLGLYNCTMKSKLEWYSYGRANIPFGFYCILIGVFYMACTLPCLYVMTTAKELRMYTSYKIMIFLLILQCFSLVINCFITGGLFLDGAVFCNYPRLIYIAGSTMFGVWEAQLSACVLLATNRLLEFWNITSITRLFEGRRIFAWFLGPLMLGIFYACYPIPSLFSSKHCNWFSDPYFDIDDIERDTNLYVSAVGNYGNFPSVTVIAVLYVLLIVSVLWKAKQSNSRVMSSLQRSITIQAALVTSLDFATGFFYVYMNYGITGRAMTILSLVLYQASCGISGIVYLVLNRTIRKQVVKVFTGTKISTVVSFAHRHNSVHQYSS